MGEIVGAGLVSHVPTIMTPDEDRLEIYDGKDTTLIKGLERIRKEVLDVLKPDAVIVFDTHWATLIEFIVTSHERRTGKFTSEELPRGMSQVPYDLKGDPELALLIEREVNGVGTRCTAIDDPYLPINYGTVNVAHHLKKDEAWLSVGVCMSADANDYLSVGEGIRCAIEKSDRRVVLLASGSMSHTFRPFRDISIGKYEAANPEFVFSAEAREADYERLAWFKEGNHAAVIDTMGDYYRHRPEGGFGHYLMMVGALGARNCRAKGRQFSEYENSVGTSQVHVWFDRPEDGWNGLDNNES
ncbi:catechol 1,2-dioxygenase [Kordiimonas lipolytica]|uniref:Catechol 1,2-dioxygenase n=1 Tax=Kordiimonas lipolytica TaxID=1662421 RepID=A0ABV8U8Y8_9PROT|nr:catechol 1,2-dioxygenase [Kordiimonas lipolytica]